MHNMFESGVRQRLGHDNSGKKRWLKPLGVLLAVVLVIALIVAVIGFFASRPNVAGLKPDLYQAVVLDNGQVYFGKITQADDNYTYLTNVFYPERPTEELQKENPDTSTVLIKLGNEIHGPEDKMMIRNEQILYWENLKSSGQVTQKINEYYAQAKQ